MIKNVVISGYYGSNNFGDECILSVLIEKLKEYNLNITVLSLEPEKTSKINNVKSVKSFNLPAAIKEIKNSDMLISGGGSLLQDVTSVKSLFYYLFIIFLAKFFKKKVFIFAQGIGPINNIFGEYWCKKLLKKVDFITVRDDKSQFLLNTWGIKAHLVCDPLFGLNLGTPNPLEKVGVQLRSIKALDEQFLNALAIQVEKKFFDKKIEIYSLQDSLDKEICSRFKTMLKNLNPNIQTEIIFKKTPKEIIKHISELKFMIAMRFHACLIAAKYGIKTLALSYDYKVQKLAEELKLPHVTLDYDTDFEHAFNLLENIDTQNLLNLVNEKKFDWSPVEKLFFSK